MSVRKMVVITSSLYRSLRKNQDSRGGTFKDHKVQGDRVYHNIEEGNKGLDSMRKSKIERKRKKGYSSHRQSGKSTSSDDDTDGDSYNDEEGDDDDGSAELSDSRSRPFATQSEMSGMSREDPFEGFKREVDDGMDAETEPYERNDNEMEHETSLTRPIAAEASEKTPKKSQITYNRRVTLTPKSNLPSITSPLSRETIDSLPTETNWLVSPPNLRSRSKIPKKSGLKRTPPSSFRVLNSSPPSRTLRTPPFSRTLRTPP